MGSIARKQFFLVASLIAAAVITQQILHFLSELKDTVTPELYLNHIALLLFSYFFPILGAWAAFRFIGGAIFALFASLIVFFVSSVSSSSVFIWTLLEYIALCYVLFRTDQHFENQIAAISVDQEKYQNERNDLEVVYKAKGEGISILFEKYSTYYNLRKLAEDLSTTFSVSELSEMAVKGALGFIPRGDSATICLADASGDHLAVVSQRHHGQVAASDSGKGDSQGSLFDQWVLRNHRRLIVTDTQQDFRFDVKEATQSEDLRSLIVAPLMHERRVIGTVRLQSNKRETFTADDLRLLDTIAVLASSALSNAMLYEQTEELAIKDSLTGLYVRRYFFERLKSEHRRALVTHRDLSVLMCDLDYFKACNDKYGHGVGDLMLVQFAKILEEKIDNGIVARYGGEEFAVMLPDVGKPDAVQLAESIRQAVEHEPFMIRREKIAMTVSIGVATLPNDALDIEVLIAQADKALYNAKHSGRNRVCSSEG